MVGQFLIWFVATEQILPGMKHLLLFGVNEIIDRRVGGYADCQLVSFDKVSNSLVKSISARGIASAAD